MSNQVQSNVKTPLDVLNEIKPSLNSFMDAIKEYPKVARLLWDEQKGNFIEFDLDVIEQVLADQALTP